MIPKSKAVRIIIFSGNANRELAQAICDCLGERMGDSTIKTFADGEISCRIDETMRGMDVFLINSTCKPVNDNLMELLVMLDACKRASARRVTAVIPYFGYARQDRKARPRDPISAKLVADLITTAGADRVLTIDLHCQQIQGFFNIPVDVLMGANTFSKYYREKFEDESDGFVVVSPDVGSVSRARKFAKTLNMPLAIIDKRRERANESEVMNIIGDVNGKAAIMFDDMVDTAGTLCHGAAALKAAGATAVYACASHAVLSDPAIERLNNSCIEELAVLDTIPQVPYEVPARLRILTVAPLFAEAIKRTYNEESISDLYYDEPSSER
ncbi:ribose-phosphate pyrophosphokinase [Clostridia bacterium]|nr:ribose-phosphate pyrophosphokinase [Clostridia bacterium]